MNTVQLVVNGVFIDLYDQDPIKLTYSIEDITNTETKSVFSRQFRVPATTHNYEFFSTAFEINGLDFDVTQKYTAQILDNGAQIVTGQFRMTKIYRSEKTGKIDYECLFLGETRSFGSILGDKMIVNLDFEDYNHVFDINTVIASWQAYPEGSITDGIFDGDIIYPLVDFGNLYTDTGVPVLTDMSGKPSGAGGSEPHFTENQAAQWLPADRFKPMIRAKVIWDKIFQEAGFTYSSEFINSDLFKQLYISAWGPEANLRVIDDSIGTFRAEMDGNQYGFGLVGINNLIWGGPGFDESTHIYTVPTTISGIPVPAGTAFTFNYSMQGAFSGEDFVGAQIQPSIMKNGVQLDFDVENVGGGASTNWYFAGSVTTNVNPGDQIYLEVIESAGGVDQGVINSGAQLRCTQALEGVNINNQLKDDYKQIDFIKDIITRFRLVMSPDKDNRQNFIIEPWKDFIASGDYFDWTKKVDLNKDFVIEPLFFTQTEEIDFTDAEGKDYLNELNVKEFSEVFGALKVDSQNELLKGKREIKTTIAPTPITQIDPGKYAPNGDTFIIPQMWAIEPGSNEDYPINKEPINPITRLLFYNGLQPTDNITWYTTDGVTGTSHLDYPMVSFYQVFPNTTNSLNLNWQAETGYIEHGAHQPLISPSVYEVYWSQYIDSLYSKWGRRVTLYIEMSSEDLREFSFDDLIFIKDTYYYVEKIYDAPIGMDSLVKVDLIKIERGISLQNPVVPPTPDEGTPWNLAPENYNDEDDFWQVR